MCMTQFSTFNTRHNWIGNISLYSHALHSSLNCTGYYSLSGVVIAFPIKGTTGQACLPHPVLNIASILPSNKGPL